jgi:hypothetical protein
VNDHGLSDRGLSDRQLKDQREEFCDRCHRPKHRGKCIGASADPDLRADTELESVRWWRSKELDQDEAAG